MIGKTRGEGASLLGPDGHGTLDSSAVAGHKDGHLGVGVEARSERELIS